MKECRLAANQLRHSAGSPKNFANNAEPNFEQFGNKQNQFARHSCYKQFARLDGIKTIPQLNAPQSNFKGLEKKSVRTVGPVYGKVKNLQIYMNRKFIFKLPKQIHGYFKPRGLRERLITLKQQTSSTSNSNEGLAACKSEKRFLSFLRSQTKTPPKFELPEKKGIGKQASSSKKLGKGKFGSVYLARDKMTGVIVAQRQSRKGEYIKGLFPCLIHQIAANPDFC